MKSKKTTQSSTAARPEGSNLEVRYGKIGISAVAAAMRCQTAGGKPSTPRSEKPRIASSE
jgi:hypothetical protein